MHVRIHFGYRRISIPLDGGKATVRPLVPKKQCAYIELMRINPEFKVLSYLSGSSASFWRQAINSGLPPFAGKHVLQCFSINL